MSRAKSKQIKELAAMPEEKRYDALSFETPLHNEAQGFHVLMENGLFEKPKTLVESAKDTKTRKILFARALEAFRRRYWHAWKNHDGRFFHALGDILQGENPAWSNRERFIYGQCWIAKSFNDPLPSASQIKRAWQIMRPNDPDVQLTQIIREAKNVSFKLPRETKRQRPTRR